MPVISRPEKFCNSAAILVARERLIGPQLPLQEERSGA
jgi:hypothetical protein